MNRRAGVPSGFGHRHHNHLALAGSHEPHTQQALERVNLKLHDVISGLTGVSGLKLAEAILRSERSPAALLERCDPQIQKTKAERRIDRRGQRR